jgi:hypothetical protein
VNRVFLRLYKKQSPFYFVHQVTTHMNSCLDDLSLLPLCSTSCYIIASLLQRFYMYGPNKSRPPKSYHVENPAWDKQVNKVFGQRLHTIALVVRLLLGGRERLHPGGHSRVGIASTLHNNKLYGYTD